MSYHLLEEKHQGWENQAFVSSCPCPWLIGSWLVDPKSVFEFSTSQKWNVPNLTEFAGKPNLLVFPKVTGRAMSTMGEEAGPSSLFIFPKVIIEGCPGERSESQLKFTWWCLLYSHLICPSQSPPTDGSPHPCHQHGQGWCSPEPLSCPGRPGAQLFSPLVWHRVAPGGLPASFLKGEAHSSCPHYLGCWSLGTSSHRSFRLKSPFVKFTFHLSLSHSRWVYGAD